MKTTLWTLICALTLFAQLGRADITWKDVGEITLTLPKGTSLAADGHFIRVTFLKDGTAIKRDFTSSGVFSGNVAGAIYEGLAKAVAEPKAFSAVEPVEDGKPVKELVVGFGEDRRKLRLGVSQKLPALIQIEAAIDLVRWNKI